MAWFPTVPPLRKGHPFLKVLLSQVKGVTVPPFPSRAQAGSLLLGVAMGGLKSRKHGSSGVAVKEVYLQ